MLTRCLDAFLHEDQGDGLLSTARMLLLPCGMLNPVPNLCTVRLAQLSADKPDSKLVDDQGLADLKDYAGNYFHNLSSQMDWADYDTVKRACMQLYGINFPAPVLAIHWWQRSWQA